MRTYIHTHMRSSVRKRPTARVGCWVLDVGCEMWEWKMLELLDVGCWMLGVGCCLLGAGCWMRDAGCGLRDVRAHLHVRLDHHAHVLKLCGPVAHHAWREEEWAGGAGPASMCDVHVRTHVPEAG